MSYTNLKNAVAGILETAYQTPADAIAELLPDSEEEFDGEKLKASVLELDKNRIQSSKDHGKTRFDEGYKKATREVLNAYEEKIREEFGVADEELKGVDLIRKVVETGSSSTTKDPKDLSEDELKTLPAVLKLLSEKEKSFSEREKEIKTEYETKIAQFGKERVFNEVSKKALSILDSLNPVLSTDPVKAQNQKNILLRELQSFEFQEVNGEIVPMKDGKRYENDHGHGVSLETLVKDTAGNYFDFKQADQRDAPPAGQGSGAGGGIKIPKTESEYAKIMTDTSIPMEQRLKIKEAFHAQTAEA